MMANASAGDSGDFFMLGVIHRDERNREILNQWLEKLRPDVITLEISQYSLDFRKITGPMYREKLDGTCSWLSSKGLARTNVRLESLYSFLDMPAEFAIADEYRTRNNIDVYPIDMDFFSFLKLRWVDELINEKNVQESLAETHERLGPQERVLAELYFHKGVVAFLYDEEMAMRDRYMCRKIDILRKRHRAGRFLHIAGWQHLRDPLSLYDPFRPVKIFPYD